MVRSIQFVHLSCIKISTISKQSKLSFQLSPFTKEYHRLHPKWYLSPWCIRRKLGTYLTPKLTLSPNRPKRDSIWHMSSRSSIGMRPNGFLSLWYVPCKPCTYLASRLALSPNRLNRPSTWASSPRSIIACFHNSFRAYGALCANHSPILHLKTLSPNILKQDSIWHTGSRSSIGFVQIDFQEYGMFHANRTPILHQD